MGISTIGVIGLGRMGAGIAATLLRNGGLLPVVRSGTTLIDMGTTIVRETQRLHALFAARSTHT